MLKTPSERGRRAGAGDTRAGIREAARTRFLSQGYQSVTLREIASDAGVDVALIAYYFGSKQGLFGDAMALPINPAQVVTSLLDGDPATLAERLLRTLISVWDSADVGAQLQAVAFTALGDSNMLRLISDGIALEIINRITDHFGKPDGDLRAAAFTTQTVGLIFSRYILKLEPVASMELDEIVDLLGPALQLALEPHPRSAKASTAKRRQPRSPRQIPEPSKKRG
jgi:AcrR family transcriptional regulator